MTDIENIQNHIERLVLEASEVAMLVARYGDMYERDDRVCASILRDLAERDEFFVGLGLGEFREALERYGVGRGQKLVFGC